MNTDERNGWLPPPNTKDIHPRLEGFFSDREGTFYSRLCEGRRVLELGSWKGRSTIFAAIGARYVVAVDTWKGDKYTGRGEFWPEFEANVATFNVADKVFPFRGDIATVVPLLHVRQFDVIHYDADHDTQPTEAILSELQFRTRSETFILVHDYNYPNVRRVVDAFGTLMSRKVRRVDRLAVMFPVDGHPVPQWLETIGDDPTT